MIDTHCHLTHPRLRAETPAILDRARQTGLVGCVTIGTGVEDAHAARALALTAPGFVHATAGLDPFSAHAAAERFDDELGRLRDLVIGGGFVAIGEIGLDYHYDLDPRPLQAARFVAQLDLAEEVGLPVVIHVREAHDDLTRILAGRPEARGVIHSFTAGPREAEGYLALGWSLAFNGVLTFPNAEEVRDAARRVPGDRLVVETDSPYLAPVPHRGRRAEPAHVVHTLERLAEVRRESFHALAARTTANARTLFGLGMP